MPLRGADAAKDMLIGSGRFLSSNRRDEEANIALSQGHAFMGGRGTKHTNQLA
jgi:hypothetical protein